MNGAAVVAEILKREGTEFLSCYPRNPLIETCAALDIRTDPVPAGARRRRHRRRLSPHQRGKRNGVFAAQAGPGIENAFPGVAQAFTENVPVLIIPAGLPLARQYLQPVFRAADVYVPVTKWSALAHIVQELPDLMRRAYHAMRTRQGRAGDGRDPERGLRGRVQGRARLHAGAGAAHRARSGRDQEGGADAARGARTRCSGPAQGVHYAEASERLAALAELVPAPVVTTNPGKSAIPESHPLALGASTRSRPKMFTDFMAQAPTWCWRSARASPRRRSGPGVPPGKTIIHSTNDAGDINKEYRARPCGGRRRRAGARRADRRGRRGRSGPRRRQCARLAQGGGRRRQEGLARRMGEASSTPTRRRSTSTA